VGAVWMLGGLDYAAVTKNWWATTRLLWFIINSASGLYRLLPSSPASTVNHCVHGDGHAHNHNRLGRHNRIIIPISLTMNSLCTPSVAALC
jgi:hypothetical protein